MTSGHATLSAAIRSESSLARLEKRIAFLREIDALKSILRRSYLMDTSRFENSAEHSWHVSLMSWILAEHAPAGTDICAVARMMLFHDIVEIDAGDTFIYDVAGTVEKAAKEQAAATRIFGLLPEDQRDELRALWVEFETGKTPEARFARALDRLMPLLHNYHTDGKSWREHGIRFTQAKQVNQVIANSSSELWEYALALLNDAAEKGFLIDDRHTAEDIPC
ncbi:HD domain-containing protein [Chrysiogenes arsenatis]|uniref:HD domain-containing protein n=1 Tax=Chrysiogenes arsenatis TaxID=309797 RepID=UPI0003FD4D03|nr:HD domain-containing protein [Chrysiogenes arsenatis]